MAKKQFSKASLVALWAVNGIGRVSFFRCIEAQRKAEISDEEFWVNQARVWQAAALTEDQCESIKSFKNEHNFTEYNEQLKSSGVRTVTFKDRAYPQLLKLIADFPPVLFVKARAPLKDLAALNLSLAVVGTRKITSYGHLVCKTLLKEILLSTKATLVSGFMYGVDVEAMRVAYPLTRTIGVLGYGFDHCYPQYQESLFSTMLEAGVIFLSEYSPEIRPQAGNFVQRNRIVAGLAQAVLVVEAAAKSGSLITAGYAADYGRQVLAVPGSITNPYSEGTKKLLQEGASLISNSNDFWEALESDFATKKFLKQENSPKIERQQLQVQSCPLLDIFRAENRPLDFDYLMITSRQPADKLQELLFNLEMSGKIKNQGGNYVLNA